MSKIKFKKAEIEVLQLFEEIDQLKSTILKKEVKILIEELNKKLFDLKDKIKLEIAFVGQYSAGKSTIISALSGNKSIKIGQDITTDEPHAYPWGNVLLVDTPGINAGRPDHDRASIEYMDKADLLVYVITTQGFTSETAVNFKKMAFEENRIKKTMLVINKSSQGDRELSEANWISDSLQVTEPKTAHDLFLSVIDAKDYIEAFDFEDESDRNEMISYSGFQQFLNNLDQFVSEREIFGRFITPINVVQDYLNRIIDQLTACNDDTKNLLELLRRKHFRLIKSEKELTKIVNDHVGSLVSKIKEEGNRIAALIEKDGDSETLKKESENSEQRLKEFSDNSSKKIEYAIESELSSLQLELDVLMQSELARTLLNQDSINVKINSSINLKGFDKERVNSGIDILNKFSNFAKEFATNSKAVESAGKAGKVLAGLKTASGSEAHKVIYSTGKFFGKKFKPYEAVKIASKFGKIGSIVAKATMVLPFLVAGFEEYQEYNYAKKIKVERQKIRQSYEEIATSIKESFQTQFDEFLEESYRIEIGNTKEIIDGIRNSEKMNDKESQKIQKLLEKSERIIEGLV